MTQIFLSGHIVGCWYREGEPKMGGAGTFTGKGKF